jgi:hypothetical protein
MFSHKSAQPNPPCPQCHSKSTIKKGRRLNRFRNLQIFQCRECLYKFTAAPGKNKTYTPRVILETVSTYNLGNSVSDTQAVIRKRLHVDTPEATIRSWMREYKPLTAYARLRALGQKLFRPDEMIRSFLLNHKQVYRFQLHRAKLELLLRNAYNNRLTPIKNYLELVGDEFPHGMFQATEHRSSKFPTTVAIPITRKENYATRLATLVLPAAIANKKRHETLQRFMLVNDSATIAVEIPVYLTREDIAYYKGQGFRLDFDTDFITGHLDFREHPERFLACLERCPSPHIRCPYCTDRTGYPSPAASQLRRSLQHHRAALSNSNDSGPYSTHIEKGRCHVALSCADLFFYLVPEFLFGFWRVASFDSLQQLLRRLKTPPLNLVSHSRRGCRSQSRISPGTPTGEAWRTSCTPVDYRLANFS